MTTAREAFITRSHDKHPFHLAVNEDRLSPDAIRRWVANCFYELYAF